MGRTAHDNLTPRFVSVGFRALRTDQRRYRVAAARRGECVSAFLRRAAHEAVQRERISTDGESEAVIEGLCKVRLGEKNGAAKLTADQALEIFRRYQAGGVTQQELADEYGVDRSNISRIASGENWCTVTAAHGADPRQFERWLEGRKAAKRAA